MQTRNISRSWPRVSVTMPRSGVIAYCRGFTLTAWFLSLLIGLWWETDWFALHDLIVSGYDRKQYFYYGILAAVLGHLTLGLDAWISAVFDLLSDRAGQLMISFCVLMLLLAPASALPKSSALYAVATAGAVILMWLFWSSNYRVLQRVLVITGFALFGWLLILLLHHGLIRGFGSAIGGVNRNVTGTAGLAAMVCAMFSPRKAIRWLALAGAVFFSVVVTSRGSMVALAAFLAIYVLLYKGTLKAVLVAGAVGLMGLAVFLVSATARTLCWRRCFNYIRLDAVLAAGSAAASPCGSGRCPRSGSAPLPAGASAPPPWAPIRR